MKRSISNNCTISKRIKEDIFWNHEISSKLWNPDNNNSTQSSNSTCFNLSAKHGSNKWFRVSFLQKTSKLSQSEKYVCRSIIKHFSTKYGLNLNSKDIKQPLRMLKSCENFGRWFGFYRKIHNSIIFDSMENNIKPRNFYKKITDEIPQIIIDIAIDKAFSSLKTNERSILKKKQNSKESIIFTFEQWTDIKSYFPDTKLKQHQSVELTRSQNNEFFLRKINPQTKNEHSIVSLDPGTFTFMTGYSPNGFSFEWASDDIKRIRNMYRAYQETKSLHILNDINQLIEKVHEEFARFIVENFTIILIPQFRCSSKINPTEDVKFWSQSKFHEKLQYFASKSEKPCIIEIVSEEHTTKICGNCGITNLKIGVKKQFDCSNCSNTIYRDINSARNILMKYINKHM